MTLNSMFSIRTVILVAILINLFGNYMFFCGFLPNNNDNIVNFSHKTPAESMDSSLSTQRFDKLIFIIIDAFRADFAFNFALDFMPFLKSKIDGQSNESCSFISKANLPTVTMPRIKGITSGSIPSFQEILFNSVSSKFDKDNFINQFCQNNFSLVFYGDDTWLKLFPNTFKRADGTNSFYVNDYTEVDDNVTRHLESELEIKKYQDWDVLILHYLGLDHIGHTVGPFSPLIRKKLLEMDDIIKDIYKNITYNDKVVGKKTLMSITGDHGMSNAGSHGGSSEEEVNTPVIFLSKSLHGNKFENSFVHQTDIASTLSILFGLKIPMHSIGKPMPIKHFLYNSTELKFVNRRVACQLLNVASPKIFSFTERELLKDLCIGIHDNYDIIDIVSHKLHSNSSDYQTIFMVVGIIIMAMSAILFFIVSRKCLETPMFISQDSILRHFSTFWIFVSLVSLTSSSFIEEEQYIHYHFLPSYLVLTCLYKLSNFSDAVFLLAILRILRGWNRTGVKWSGLSDIEDILKNDNVLLLIIISIGLLFLILKLKRYSRKPVFVALISLLLWYKTCGAMSIKMYICSKTSQLFIPRFIFLFSIIHLILDWRKSDAIKIMWMFISLLLLRPTHITWFCLVILANEIITFNIIPTLCKRGQTFQIFLFYLGISHFSHFAQGNSNNFSTVDIAAGFIGLDTFYPILSILLPFLATFCTKFYWDISFISSLKNHSPKLLNNFGVLLCLYQMIETLIYCFVVYLMKYHLFIWSVFAPKYFYLMAQSVFNLLVVVPIILYIS